jgi:hypothetical protein
MSALDPPPQTRRCLALRRAICRLICGWSGAPLQAVHSPRSPPHSNIPSIACGGASRARTFWLGLLRDWIPSQQKVMRRSQHQHPGGWPSDDENSFECIDLTQSPDPPLPAKPQPQLRRLPQQQQLPKYFKTLPTGMASGSVLPGHLRRIINTSDPTAIRDVLLNLCKLSPALSGAVARGLAPHSSFAQETIRDYRKKVAVPTIKSDPGNAAKSASAKVKKDRRVSPSTPPPIRRETQTVSVLTDDEEDVPDFFYTDPRPGFADPLSRSSWNRHAVAPNYAPKESKSLSTSKLPLRDITKPTSRTPSQTLAQPTSIKTEPKLRGKICKQCGERFKDEGSSCIYHSGHEVTITNDHGERASVYSCCREPLNGAGCIFGTHLADPAEGLTKPRPLTGWSPTMHDREPKKPRLL